MIKLTDDLIVNNVLKKHINRSNAGMQKYGVTMMREDTSTLEWLHHAQQEAMDFAIYLERLIYDLETKRDFG